MRKLLPTLAALILGALALVPAIAAPPPDKDLVAAIANPARTASFASRDTARHPAEELTFFGLQPTMSVVEIWPGGGYWTEILGPYLKARGHYTVALSVPGDAEEDAITAKWHERIAAQAGRLGTVHETFAGPGHFDLAPPASADLVLTFRNLHNWMDGGYAEQMLQAAFRALKPGGVLGIEAHRGRTDQPQDPKAQSGYVREDYAIALAKKAGFELVDKSEINANPKDTKDWPDGVWTLPPTLAQQDKDRARYLAIGEADNFVLKFRKPKH
ncbi:MAG: methyltransferase [Pseudomonadota bacterium]